MPDLSLKYILCCTILIAFIRCESNPSNTTPPVYGGSSKELNYIFTASTEGYSCFRIPALVRTQDGTLLAFAEARKNNCSDSGDIDLVLKRSTDNGQTWGDLKIIWDDGNHTVGNPVPIVDQNTGNIHLVMCWNNGDDDFWEIATNTGKDTRRVYYARSEDDGKSWTTPREITSSVKKSNWSWYGTGPMHGIQMRKGKDKGRLVVPGDYINGVSNYSHIIYSDDSGKTWQLGGTAPRDRSSESTVAELSDGSLMLNTRNESPYRWVSTSTDGGQTWGAVRTDSSLVEPTCQGSLLSGKFNTNYVVLFSNPASNTRNNLTIKLSTNDGQTWDRSYQVWAGPAAYSDMAILAPDRLGILYEAGDESPYEGISFNTIRADSIR